MSQAGNTEQEIRYEFLCREVNHLEQLLRKFDSEDAGAEPIKNQLGLYRGELAALRPKIKEMRRNRRGKSFHGERTRYDVLEDILLEIKGLRADLSGK